MNFGNHLSLVKENLGYIVDIVIYSRFYIAASSPLLLYALSYLESFSFSPNLAVTVFGAFFGVYAMNRKSDIEEDEANLEFGGPDLAEKTYKVGIISLFLSIITALMMGTKIFAVTIAFISILSAYSFRLFPSSFRYRRLKEIPLVKNMVVGFSLGLLWISGGVSSLSGSSPNLVLGIFLFLSIRVFIGSVIPDIRDIEGDRKAGITTLPVALGVDRTRKILLSANAIATITYLWMIYNNMLPPWSLYAVLTSFLTFLVIAKSTEENSGRMTILSELNTQIVFPALLILGALI
ncbi:MAG: 4-hydroxybenzoate polyprenyltransferase related protein [Candidatus Nanosalina sp. J07AB43]|jgi:4-hydroxybenzoate polyprenyltransferase and related prenyltransferases|nr:MAG: 4-hydroxybenzoate polyprenyltransferase related protein [Candidatus Nanosalina sp. J07AB43]